MLSAARLLVVVLPGFIAFEVDAMSYGRYNWLVRTRVGLFVSLNSTSAVEAVKRRLLQSKTRVDLAKFTVDRLHVVALVYRVLFGKRAGHHKHAWLKCQPASDQLVGQPYH